MNKRSDGSGFRKVWRGLKAGISVVIAVYLFVLICDRASYLYVREDDWERILWHHYYESDSIDNVFIGSSHVFCDVDPFLLDEINGMNNFNLSTSGLRLNGAYYVLKEAADRHDLQNVYLELYYVVTTEAFGRIDSQESISCNWGITDYAEFSWDTLAFMASMSGPDQYIETVFPFIRYREHLFDYDYILENIEKKQTLEYNSYHFRREDENGIIECRDKGFYYTTRQYQEEDLAYGIEVDLEKTGLMPADVERYLRKIIEYCQKSGIHLALFVSPIYETQILGAKDYDAYYDQVSAIAAEYGVPFYDFNLCKSEYLDIMHRELFLDSGHLNTAGADVFTPFLWKVLSGTEENNQIYFCDSYEEKIRLDEAELYGVYYSMNGKGECEYTIASNRMQELEYRVIVSPGNAEARMLQDFSINKNFTLPREEHGIITVVARDAADHGHVQTLEMNY
ncbi:MAG: hypothetical protein NC254_07990 [bacterium]|nr:hypothetical protein [bacterium]